MGYGRKLRRVAAGVVVTALLPTGMALATSASTVGAAEPTAPAGARPWIAGQERPAPAATEVTGHGDEIVDGPTSLLGEGGPIDAVNDSFELPSGYTWVLPVLENDIGGGETSHLVTSTGVSADGENVTCDDFDAFCSYEASPSSPVGNVDTFTYTVTDGITSDTATVTITIVANEPPIAVDDEVDVVATNGPKNFTPLANDADDFVTVWISSSQTDGTGDGSLACDEFSCTYTPGPPGSDTDDDFNYTITDGELEASAVIHINIVECPNLLPGSVAIDPGDIISSTEWIHCAAPSANDFVGMSPTGMSGIETNRLLLTTGTVLNAEPPNDFSQTGTDWETDIRGAHDVSVLALHVTVPPGRDCIAFDAVFATDEYPEFVGLFNDGFIAQLDVDNWSVNEETQAITAPGNIAIDPQGNVLSVNAAFAQATVTETGTEYDGATPLVKVQSPVTPGAHTLYLSIFDAGDGRVDSGVFIENLRAATTPVGQSCQVGATVDRFRPADFDGDGDSDRSVWRPSTGQWFADNDGTIDITQFGLDGDIPVPADYDGDGDTDQAVYRPAVGGWYINDDGVLRTEFHGLPGDIPVPADYDGDGVDDIAVFRPAVGGWYIMGQMTRFVGLSGDVPVPADFDGDHKTNLAIWRPAVGGWYWADDEGTVHSTFVGLSSDIPVPGDYDGDGFANFAVWRPAVGGWYILDAESNLSATFVGLSTDIPVPADYNGDAVTDIAIWRPAVGGWYWLDGEGAPQDDFLGAAGDIPSPLSTANLLRSYPGLL
jgi:hypothetical protein